MSDDKLRGKLIEYAWAYYAAQNGQPAPGRYAQLVSQKVARLVGDVYRHAAGGELAVRQVGPDRFQVVNIEPPFACVQLTPVLIDAGTFDTLEVDALEAAGWAILEIEPERYAIRPWSSWKWATEEQSAQLPSWAKGDL